MTPDYEAALLAFYGVVDAVLDGPPVVTAEPRPATTMPTEPDQGTPARKERHADR